MIVLYQQKIEYINRKIDNVCIGVDVIVGFPGETEEDFQETYHFLKSLEISYLHVFTYSERENTKAIKLEPVVPYEERARRSKILRELSDQKRDHFYERSVGQIRPVLVEKSKNGVESNGYCFFNVFWYVENGGNFFFGHREYFDKWNFT